MAYLFKLGSTTPKLGKDVFLAETATVIGDVEIGDFSSVWYNAVLRGDLDKIRVGRYTNIQDNTVVHVDRGFPVEIGDYVVIGHSAVIHGCVIGDNVMIGMNSCILNGAHVSERSIVAAGAVVTGKKYPPNSVLMGVPARVVREITDEEFEREVTNRWKEYRELAKMHFGIKRVGEL
ncbi:gamma carbonic anhydrase family protein [Archaeoglobales archaeon]|nr:MAG: gamma carbonic anhydrase family protein [Archaeoglobales archaeon]